MKYKEINIPDKILNKIFGKAKRADVDERVSRVMEFIYRQTEYNVDLVIENQDYTADLKALLEDIPYNRIVLVKGAAQIAQRLLTGDLSYYIDDNDYRRSLVNNKYAITLDELDQTIKLRI